MINLVGAEKVVSPTRNYAENRCVGFRDVVIADGKDATLSKVHSRIHSSIYNAVMNGIYYSIENLNANHYYARTV